MEGRMKTKNKIWSRALLALAAVGALLFGLTGPWSAGAVTPSQDACKTVNNNTPRGDCGPFKQVYAENFNAQTVPVGAFSQCAGEGDFRCAGLKTKYPRYYSTLGAYPVGWTDTAGHNGDGNSGPVPGDYRPDKTMSVIKSSTGDGQMRVRMTYSGGRNQVAAVVPVKCNFRYGKVTERFIVRGPLSDRFKMAHLRYTPDEIDYPEAGGTFKDPIYEYTHGFASSAAQAAPNSAWTSWHTYSTEITPGKVKFYFDGKLFKTVSGDYPRSAFWILQNESALGVSRVSGPTSQVIDTTWLTCYKYQP
jgi:hypothetical protein